MTGSSPRVVLVAGVAYSGSTLLDLLLGTHSRVLGVGEVVRFDDFVTRNQYCTCLERAGSCPFWGRVLGLLTERAGDRPFRLHGDEPGRPARRLTAADVADTLAFYRAAAEVAGATAVVDSSKELGRVRAIGEAVGRDGLVIHLLRDGRAVTYSHTRRGTSAEAVAGHWRDTNLAIREWLGGSGAPPSTEVYYEDLCAQPRSALEPVLARLGLDWEPEIVTRWHSRTAHNVGGNMMRYLDSGAIREDLSWRDELGVEQVESFDRVAGKAFGDLGYPRAGGGPAADTGEEAAG